jgi:hypothetical protein
MSKLDLDDIIFEIKYALKDVKPIWLFMGLIAVLMLGKYGFFAALLIGGAGAIYLFRNHGVLIASILADIADYLGASVPVVGDFLDIFIVILQSRRYGVKGFIDLSELIPFVDLLPILSLNAAFAEHERKQKLLD